MVWLKPFLVSFQFSGLRLAPVVPTWSLWAVPAEKWVSNFIAAQSSATLNYILVERGSGAGVDPLPQNRVSQEQPK